MSAPQVTLLPPRPGLDNAHHGPAQATGIKLFDAPTQFHNPWKSFRLATPTDIWTAYQKGAAVAPAQKPSPAATPGDSTPALASGSASGVTGAGVSETTLVADAASASTAVDGKGGAGDKVKAAKGAKGEDGAKARGGVDGDGKSKAKDDDEDSEDETPTYAEEAEAGEEQHSQHPPEEITCYIRPELQDPSASDDEDDWREPPLRVVKPAWAPSFAPSITWLGHASVLLRIPWTNPPKPDPVSSSAPADMCNVLMDPIFSERCSPSQSFGPTRYLNPPCGVDQLPPIHAVLISHDHYDHLDYNSVLDLWAFHHKTVHFFVPLGLAKWFHQCGIPEGRITELDWWHEVLVSFPAEPTGEDDEGDEQEGDEGEGEAEDEGDGEGDGKGEGAGGREGDEDVPVTYGSTRHPPPAPRINLVDANAEVDPSAALNLKIVLTPAQHRSGRGIFDQMTTLWGSWVVCVINPPKPSSSDPSSTSTTTHDPLEPGALDWSGFKLFFGGDTGYRYAGAADADPEAVCPAFREIAELYGPFDLALLPLSAGSSLPFLRKTLNLSFDHYTLTSALHCSPEDSVQIHKLLPAKRSFGIHWGTWSDVSEARATRVTFGRARREGGLKKNWPEKGCFVVADIGETLVLPKD